MAAAQNEEIASLLHEIESSTSRISDLVGAIKEYTHMDQAPVQNVDVVKSLETTLTILNHKLKKGVAVQRDYQPVPLLVNSFGSELNQVWTNIIDNAIDAMHGKGELRIRTYRNDGCVVVEIGDNGPGIPEEVQPHIFEPFSPPKSSRSSAPTRRCHSRRQAISGERYQSQQLPKRPRSCAASLAPQFPAQSLPRDLHFQWQ